MKMLQSIRLTDNQKRVLANIKAAQTPKVAADRVSTGEGIIAARDLLARLGVISFDPTQASVTDKGQRLMQDEAMTDDSGQLTADAQQYVNMPGEPEMPAEPVTPEMGGFGLGTPPAPPEASNAPLGAPEMAAAAPEGNPGNVSGTFESDESFKLIKNLLKL